MKHYSTADNPADIPTPLIPVNRGIHAQEPTVVFEHRDEEMTIVLWLKDSKEHDVRIEVSEQRLLIWSEHREFPIREALEMPRRIKKDTLRTEYHEDCVMVTVALQENSCFPHAVVYQEAESPLEHPRSEAAIAP